MLDIARLTKSLAEAFPEHQAQKLAVVISEALQSVLESEVIRRLDELIEVVNRLVEVSQRHDEQIFQNTQATAENARAIAELRAVTEKHDDRIERLIAVAQQHSEQIAENTRAIAELRAVTEKHSEQIAENTRAIAENTRAIAELRAATERLAQISERHERGVESLKQQLGGLSATVGYTLENAAYKALPALLARDYGIEVQGRLTRDYVVAPDGSAYEVNILGSAVQNGRRLTIVGESKVQLSVQEIDRFLRRKLKPLQSLVENPFPVLVAHMVTSPKVLPHAREKGVAVYLSYEFE